jgi:hypothetical protein
MHETNVALVADLWPIVLDRRLLPTQCVDLDPVHLQLTTLRELATVKVQKSMDACGMKEVDGGLHVHISPTQMKFTIHDRRSSIQLKLALKTGFLVICKAKMPKYPQARSYTTHSASHI